MGRPRIEWSDSQVRAFSSAVAVLDRHFPRDNTGFLDGLVAAVRATTGRVYGATTYGRLLRDVAPQVGVRRRPSTPTIQSAVLRAQALERGAVQAAAEASALLPADSRVATAAAVKQLSAVAQRRKREDARHPVTVDADALRASLTPLLRELLRESIAPLHARAVQRMSSNAGDESARELQLTTAALKDARARIRQLEFEMGELRRELGAAQAARDLAGVHVSAMLEDLREAIAASRQGRRAARR
jgi:hypothetical protein